MKPTPAQVARQGAATLAAGLRANIERAKLIGDRAVYITLEEAESMQVTATNLCALLVDLDNAKVDT